ncbi:MAG: CorA family divalent cation transporter [Minisyncoccia bacterium]
MKIERNVSPAVWIDLSSPTRDEIKSLLDEKKIPIHLVDELVSPSDRPMAMMADGVLYSVFHFPKSHKESNDAVEIDFVVGRDFVITAHYEPVSALDHFSKLVEVESIIEHENTTAADGPLLFSAILTRLYENMYDELEVMESMVREAEEHIFAGHEKKMVFQLSRISRMMLNFRKILEPHERILHQLGELTEKHFGETYKMSILGSFEKVKGSLKSESEIVHELQETNAQLLNTKQNEIINTLTILAFLTMPATLISAIFTIPAQHIPIIGTHLDFWIIFGIMSGVSLVLLIFVKLRKWI